MKINGLKLGGIATAVALASVIASCSNNAPKTESGVAKTTSTDVQKESIVYVNSDTLLAKYEYSKDIQKKMETKGKAADNDLAAKGQAFQREVQQYQSQANTLPADQRAATEQRLARKQQELQAYQQNAGAALQNEHAKEQEALYNKVTEFLKSYAKDKGYKMVLTYAKGNSAILYAEPGLDVTAEVLKGLNDAYTKDKK
ncbi:OmpH family outer membrane protein [Pedobacter montanisoli]|uniref:OmpH family outer membrane protein n=1 Tax=Pedobacter montanisoli TaxID=2923277 RepID=A0ABS9ZWS4_9SPHI|nr:OmpH family outer membrane protein [Pedobacter montanisoli]MCJ0742760.1 OmpH family outer membrane protein [Pedobacter montanisoli]